MTAPKREPVRCGGKVGEPRRGPVYSEAYRQRSDGTFVRLNERYGPSYHPHGCECRKSYRADSSEPLCWVNECPGCPDCAPCGTCGGSKSVKRRLRTHGHNMDYEAVCPTCGGTGQRK